MKKYSIALNLGLALAAIGLAAAVPASALTPPALKISDGTNTVTIDATGVATCTGTCTTASSSGTASAAGSVSWMGTVGSFNVTFAQGQSNNANFAYPDLGFTVANNGSATGTITATWSDINYTGGPINVVASPITTISGGVGSVVYSYYTDNTNTLFGTGSLVGTLSNVTATPASTPTWATATTSAAFAATEVEAITLAPGASFNGDNQMITFNTPLTVSCAVASGKMGTAYSSSVGAAGGVAPYTFTVTSGALPGGLSLNTTTGLISGTPSAAGTFSYTITVNDSQGYYAQSSCGMTIALGGGGTQGGTLTLACPSSSATQSTQYSSSFVATGGVSPYAFSISSGSLPAGLSLNASTGAITGKPTGTGSFSFTGKVVDSTTGTALSTTSTCGMTIAAKPSALSLSCATGTGSVGAAYSSSVVATGGTKPYASYTLTSGKLPPGLTLNTATGAITGTPTTAGTYSYTIEVKDANGAITTDSSGSGRCSSSGCSITIKAPAPVTLKCPTSTAKVGTAYSSAATASGGTAPYTFSIGTGALPPGLTLNPNGTISGTPTTPGTSNFVLQVKDAVGTTVDCTGNCNIVVAAAITINCPPSSATKGTAYSTTLKATGGTAPYTFSVSAGSLPNGLTLNPTTGVISGTPSASGTFSVSFKVVDAKGLVGVTNCNSTSCGGDYNNDGNNGWGGQGWGGDDDSSKNGQCVAQITVCDPSNNWNWNWGWGWGW